MKHAFQLASLSVAALALSAQAGKVKTFDINFDDYPANAAPSGSVAGGAWTPGTGDASAVEVKSGSDKQLVIDAASDHPLTFTPSETTTTTIEMDVQFVGASEAPATSLTGTQAALYLHKTSGLQVSVAGGAFTAFVDDTTQQAPTVAENTRYKLTITFAYGTGTTIVLADAQEGTTLATYKSASTVSGKSGVVGVDFYGSGLVDNFTGSYALDSATDTDNDTSADTSSDTEMTVSNGVLTTQFASNLAGTGALKFIKVTGTDRNGATITRTLRVVGGNQAIAISNAGFASVSKVVAYYGDTVTATAAGDAATAPAVTTEEGTTKVTGSVTAKSGLYYGVVVNGTATPLNGGAPVAPEHHGETLNYEVPVSATPYGVQKFKIVASDDPVTAQ